MYTMKKELMRIRGEQQLNPKDNSILFHCFRNEEVFGGWVAWVV